MSHKLARLASLLLTSADDSDTHVHFHRGPQGGPMVCHDAGCEMPRLSV